MEQEIRNITILKERGIQTNKNNF